MAKQTRHNYVFPKFVSVNHLNIFLTDTQSFFKDAQTSAIADR
ncbi:hypothetical protein [Chroococcidiopsis sp. TS-821]|nr:hypothetical protein [Chroococcidiopsis sp. TS-821]